MPMKISLNGFSAAYQRRSTSSEAMAAGTMHSSAASKKPPAFSEERKPQSILEVRAHAAPMTASFSSSIA